MPGSGRVSRKQDRSKSVRMQAGLGEQERAAPIRRFALAQGGIALFHLDSNE